MGLSDTMLDGGCARHVEAAHGETVTILSGLDAGKKFQAVRENSSDVVLTDSLTTDLRAKRSLRFRDSTGVPRLSQTDRIKTADGKVWNAVKAPQDGYLTTDFDLVEIVAVKDQ